MTEGTLLAQNIRRVVLEQSKRANVGHIGSALSIADIMAVLYAGPLGAANVRDNDRDRFVLSKGHASLAMYAAMSLTGKLSEEQISSFCSDDSLLGVHPEHALPGVDFSTGSLGQGVSFGTGAALAARKQGSHRRTFVVMSDAELNEGITWEALMFAAHHNLSNLIVIVDVNGQQALGYTKDVLNLSSLADRWRAFGWDVHEVDGHDVPGLAAVIDSLDTTTGSPHVLLARTTFGKGVSFMESTIKWHYMPMNDAEFAQAMQEVIGV